MATGPDQFSKYETLQDNIEIVPPEAGANPEAGDNQAQIAAAINETLVVYTYSDGLDDGCVPDLEVDPRKQFNRPETWQGEPVRSKNENF